MQFQGLAGGERMRRPSDGGRSVLEPLGAPSRDRSPISMTTQRTTTTQMILLALAYALAASCGASSTLILPAPTAETAGARNVATTTEGGVMAEVATEAWNSFPPDLEKQVTPIRLTLVNQSGEPVKVRYQDLQLVSQDGRVYRALPPFRIDKEVEVRAVNPEFEYTGFALSPYYGGLYSGMGTYGYGFGYDRGYYSYYDYWEADLPTDAMLRKALPEGVIEPGGRVSGFVYFEHIKPNETDRVAFTYDVEHAEDGMKVSRLSIPLMVREEG